MTFLNEFLDALEDHDTRTIGRVWIKAPGGQFVGRSVYTSSIQSVCEYFQTFLKQSDGHGIVVCDSRNKSQDVSVSHSIFTQKHQRAGDPYDRIYEMPLFGRSDNHVGLQVADLLCSALLFPMAIYSFCQGHVTNTHIRPGYEEIKKAFGARLRALQYRFQDPSGRWRGGWTVSDPIAKRSGAVLFA
jgi:hypothetical protein